LLQDPGAARGCRGPGGMQKASKRVLVDGNSGKVKGHRGNTGLDPSVPFAADLAVTPEQPCPLTAHHLQSW